MIRVSVYSDTISIHVPTWGTTSVSSSFRSRDAIFQFTFPRGERRYMKPDGSVAKGISIHVPTWGTTQLQVYAVTFNKFQFTFPRGERPTRPVTFQDFSPLISIHVPTWGTTHNLTDTLFDLVYFNSRSHVGNDPHNTC